MGSDVNDKHYKEPADSSGRNVKKEMELRPDVVQERAVRLAEFEDMTDAALAEAFLTAQNSFPIAEPQANSLNTISTLRLIGEYCKATRTKFIDAGHRTGLAGTVAVLTLDRLDQHLQTLKGKPDHEGRSLRDFEREVTKAKKRAKQVYETVKTLDETGATLLFLYTAEVSPYQSSFSYQLQRAIKPFGDHTRRHANFDHYAPFAMAIQAALSQLPRHTGEVYRAVPQTNISGNYPDGEYVLWTAFGSCTKVEPKQAWLKGEENMGTVFVIACKCAFAIEQWSYYPEEQEVLLPACSWFKVKKTDKTPNITYIYLEQLEPLVFPGVDERQLVLELGARTFDEQLHKATTVSEFKQAITNAEAQVKSLQGVGDEAGLLNAAIEDARQRLQALKAQPTTFATSNFKEEYECYPYNEGTSERKWMYKAGLSPGRQYAPVDTAAAVLAMVKEFLFHYCDKHGLRNSSAEVMACNNFYKTLAQETAQHAAVNMEVLGEIGATAELLWTSNTPFSGMPDRHSEPLYRLLNMALICDWPETAKAVAGYARAFNMTFAVSRVQKQSNFPEDGITYRGGGFGLVDVTGKSPADLKRFFVPNCKYRVPQFLATSFSEEVAKHFISQAASTGAPEMVLWHVHTDQRGDPDNDEYDDCYRCKHVNFIQHSQIMHPPGHPQEGRPCEDEYLFAPYSVFTVLFTQWRAGTRTKPHIIHISAAVDNLDEPEDLPLAPWA